MFGGLLAVTQRVLFVRVLWADWGAEGERRGPWVGCSNAFRFWENSQTIASSNNDVSFDTFFEINFNDVIFSLQA